MCSPLTALRLKCVIQEIGTTEEKALYAPEEKVPEVGDITCYQSRVEISGKTYLLRVMVNETMNPALVVTMYRTSKISKYWRKP
jgi:hypothetical protein